MIKWRNFTCEHNTPAEAQLFQNEHQHDMFILIEKLQHGFQYLYFFGDVFNTIYITSKNNNTDLPISHPVIALRCSAEQSHVLAQNRPYCLGRHGLQP